MSDGHLTFAPTRWSLVARAASATSAEARDALEHLCRAYWTPLYVFLRRRGYSCDDSADLVQGLFVDLIEKGRFAHADPDRGRFRSWLLAALCFHASHARERQQAAKRGGGVDVVSLDTAEAESRWIGISPREQEPERAFDRAWAMTVLDRALDVVERRHTSERQRAVFAALRPALVGSPEPDEVRSIGVRLGMSESAVKTAAFRLRQAFAKAIRAEVASTLERREDVDAELRALFAALSIDRDVNS